MNYALTEIVEKGHSIVLNQKTGKTGSFARAVAFADRDTRMGIGQALYAKWLQNGQYRPLVDDVVDTLVPKSAAPYIMGLVPVNGPVSKDALIHLCNAVVHAVEQKGKELKGQKAFVYGVVKRIAESEARTIAAEQ